MKYRFEVLCVISRVYDTDGRIKRGLEEGSLSAILLSAERESERRSRVRKSKAAAIRSSSDDERGEARRVWFRVDRGESQCIAPVGATSWLRAFVVTRGRTPVADSAESCTTWEERASEEGTEEGREGGSEKLVTSSRPPNYYSLSPQNSDLFRANFPRIAASLMEPRLTIPPSKQFQLDFRCYSLIRIERRGKRLKEKFE